MSFVSRVVRRVVSAYGPRMRRAVFGLAVVSLVVACSGDGSSDGPSSGGSSSSGASGGQSGGTGAGGSGGDPSSGGGGPQGIGGSTGGNTTGGGELRGAASLHVLSPSDCSLPEHYQDFPELSSGRPVTETAKVQGVVDGGTTPGGEPASVVCTWRPANGVVFVSAVLRIGPAGSDRFVSMGSVMVPGEAYESSITFAGPDLPDQYGGGGTCEYTAFEVDDETRSVWGTLSCEELTSLDDTDTCALGPSYFFFENCDLAD